MSPLRLVAHRMAAIVSGRPGGGDWARERLEDDAASAMCPRKSIRCALLAGATLSLYAALSACGDDEAQSAKPLVGTVRSADVRVPDPSQPRLDMERVETWTQNLANTFNELAEKLRRRDFGAAQEWLDPSFAGHSWSPLPVLEQRELPLATRRSKFDVSKAGIAGREGFLTGSRRTSRPGAVSSLRSGR